MSPSLVSLSPPIVLEAKVLVALKQPLYILAIRTRWLGKYGGDENGRGSEEREPARASRGPYEPTAVTCPYLSSEAVIDPRSSGTLSPPSSGSWRKTEQGDVLTGKEG